METYPPRWRRFADSARRRRSLRRAATTAALLILVQLAPACGAARRATRAGPPAGAPGADAPLGAVERYWVLSGAADAPMALVTEDTAAGDELLRTPSRDADLDDPAVQHLAARMLATMRAADGVGIAAIQVGIPLRMLWAQRFDRDDGPFDALVNPVVVELADENAPGWEGCLSVVDAYAEVSRAVSLVVRYQTLDGALVEELIEGFTAVIVQHELDHLDGVLFIDRADPETFVTRAEYQVIKEGRGGGKGAESDTGMDRGTDTEHGSRDTDTEHGSRDTDTEHGSRDTDTEHGSRGTDTDRE